MQPTARVEALRKAGVSGVGQSSWGPTVFALQPDRAAASELVATLQKAPEFADCEFIVAAAENNAAEVTVGAPAAQKPEHLYQPQYYCNQLC